MKQFGRFLLLLLALLMLGTPFGVTAAASEDSTAGTTVYIAGNPDLYPLEYYDRKTGCYAGILPEIFQKIGQQTGFRFIYQQQDEQNRQKNLAANLQVEIVSAHHSDEITGAVRKLPLFTYQDSQGCGRTMCIGFTMIASSDVIQKVEDAFRSLDKDDYLQCVMDLSEPEVVTLEWWHIVLLLALALALILMGTITMYRRSKRIREQKWQERMTDPLTGIGNNEHFEHCFQHHIPEAARELYYVAYIALDMHKLTQYMNSAATEELQRFAANTLENSQHDNDFMARIDDGVFVTAFSASNPEKAKEIVEQQVQMLNRYDNSVVAELQVPFYAGIYPLGKSKTTVESAVYNARQGCRYAVQHDEPVCFCTSNILNWDTMHKDLQKKLIGALNRKEFRIYLQFVVDSKTEKIYGGEVLTRWHNPENGVLQPAYYIDDLMNAGLSVQLDFWVLEETCKLLQQWRGTEMGQIHLSCNFTRQSFSQDTFLSRFTAIVDRYSFDHRLLTLELTEDALFDNVDAVYRNLCGCKKLNCRIALDDFGSGYTSFSDLCDYPIDIIKIDRSIITKAVNKQGESLLRGVTQLAHDLGMRVLCEGVESQEELQFSRYVGCDYIQGFYFARVIPMEETRGFYQKYQSEHVKWVAPPPAHSL